MNGKNAFNNKDIEIIREKLQYLRRADRNYQKKLRHELRVMGFYISDWTTSTKGFTAFDFNQLIQNGTIKII
ncbi:MAG: hypothetical protein U1E38_07130 [Rhodospirillales bacterium]